MNHIISATIPSSCHCSVYLDDNDFHHSINAIAFHIDAHDGKARIQVYPQAAIPTNTKKLRVMLDSTEQVILTRLSAPPKISWQLGMHYDLELVDPLQTRKLLAYLQGRVNHLLKSFP